VERIQVDLVSALLATPVRLASSYLLTGNPSTGKTSVATRIAKALGLPLVVLDGHATPDRESLVAAMDSTLAAVGRSRKKLAQAAQGLPEYEYPPMVIFLDEVHLIPRKTQESLLTMTDPDGRYVRLTDCICRFPAATFVGATTRPEALDRALRTRFGPEIHLLDYTEEEVSRIIQGRFPNIPQPITLRLARLSQRIPRVAIRLSQDLLRRQQVSLDSNATWESHLAELQKAEGLDDLGLGPLHRRLLSLLAAQGGPVGLETLQNLLGESDRQYVEREILTGLQRAGFVTVQPSGRVITDEGKEYLKNANAGQPVARPEPSAPVPPAPSGTGSKAWPLTEPLCVLETSDEREVWRTVKTAPVSGELLLGFTTRLPEDILKEFDMTGIRLLKVSRVQGDSVVHPGDLDRIGSFIERHFEAGPGRFVVLPCLENLVEAGNVSNVRRLLEVARDLAMQTRGSMLVSVDKASLPDAVVATLERGVVRL